MNMDKRVEFRRRGFARAVSHIIIYATAPEKRVVGVCEVTNIVKGDPELLWRDHRKVAGITESGLRGYFRGLTLGIAISLGCVHAIQDHICLSDIGVARAPQSFQYMDSDQLNMLKSYL